MIKIKKIIKKHKKLYYWALCISKSKNEDFRRFCLDYKTNPRIIHFNEFGNANPDKNIYHITVGNSSVGMFSLVVWTLRYLEFADKFCLNPVVSWTKDISYYKDGGVKGILNPFEYFFNQTSDISLDDVCKSKNVALSRREDKAFGGVADSYELSNDEIERLSRIWEKYMSLEEDLKLVIENKINSLFNYENDKIIGVHVRGADWRKMKISGHPVTASEDEYISEIKKMLDNGKFEKVFLATDSEGTIEKFKDVFGDKLLYFDEIKRTPKESVSLVIFDEKNDPYQLGYEILLDAFALSSCAGFLAGISYVSYGVQIIKKSSGEQFEFLKIIDKGLQKSSNNDFKKAADYQRKVIKNRNAK